MKVFYKANDRLSFELEADGQKEVFKELAIIQEIFAEEQCGVCGNHNIKFVVRNVESNDYYELRCTDSKCGATLSFGQHKKGGTLFPKRKDDDNNYIPNKGWHKYTGKTSTTK
jgi:hypothetical protein